jgi:tetratricopeptide (TPR) repeat protein/serine/threonine protein kinase
MSAALPSPTTAARAAELAELVEQLTTRIKAGEPIDWDELLGEHPQYADELRGLLPAVQMLADLSRSAPGELGSDGEPSPRGELGDFRLLREVGRGGMGVVYEAEQISLGRRVALKILPYAGALDARQLQRFRNEARAAAGLNHTHIVPVYFVGCERGVHFYAMQLIEGRSLADVIAELRGPAPGAAPPTASYLPSPLGGEGPGVRGERADTAPVAAALTPHARPDRAYYRTVAQWGVQAAEALEHAHSFGVIHRDIKPANLLLNDRGELFVTDFGLAQFRADAGLTATGAVLGTYRYMSPEQAQAKHSLVDHRTDVYSLGATLYELLTLRPAFPADDHQTLLRQVIAEEPVAPRKLDKGIPAELETVTLKCLARNPSERYATAGELADDLRRWLADQTIRAKPPSLRQKVAKWTRRHQPLVRATALVVLILAGSLGWIIRDWQARRTEAEGRVAEALAAAEPKLRDGNPHDPELISAAHKAEAQLASGVVRKELRRQAEQLLADLAILAKLENIRLEQVAPKLGGGFDTSGIDLAYVQAFQAYGIDIDALGVPEAAARIGQRSIAVHLAAALDSWARARKELGGTDWKRLLAVAQQADPDPWRYAFREAQAAGRKEDLEKLLASAPIQELPPRTLALLGTLAQENKSAAKLAVAVLREGQQRYPGDFWINKNLAYLLTFTTEPPQFEEAIGFCRAALALRPQSLVVNLTLARALGGKGALDEAARACRRAIRLNPVDATAHQNLGYILREKGALDEAIAACKEAIRLKPDEAGAYNTLGNALQDKGALDEAIAAFKQAIHLKPDSGMALSNLGNALQDKGALDEAIAAHKEAIRLKPDYAEAYNNLGVVLEIKGALDEAIAACKEAIRLKPDYAEAYYNLGHALQGKGALDEAIAAYKEAIRLKPNFGIAYTNLGVLLGRTGRHEEAETAYRAALKLQEPLVADFPTKSQYRQELATTRNELGINLISRGRRAEAETAFRAALTLREQLVADVPTVLDYAVDLGVTYACLAKLKLQQTKGESAEGFEWSTKAIHTLSAVLAKNEHQLKARKFLIAAHRDRIWALLQLRQYAEALPDFDRGIELAEGSECDDFRLHRAFALVRTGQTARAVAEADSLTQGNNVPGGTLYDAACIYALASAALKDNSQQAENHAVQAITLLGRAQAAGVFQDPARVTHLKQNTGFDNLRSRADYQRLIQELEKSTRQGGK